MSFLFSFSPIASTFLPFFSSSLYFLPSFTVLVLLLLFSELCIVIIFLVFFPTFFHHFLFSFLLLFPLLRERREREFCFLPLHSFSSLPFPFLPINSHALSSLPPFLYLSLPCLLPLIYPIPLPLPLPLSPIADRRVICTYSHCLHGKGNHVILSLGTSMR